MGRPVTVILALALILVVVQPVAATHGQAGKVLPWRSTFTTTQQPFAPGDFSAPGASRCAAAGAAWFSEFNGSGTATHVGRFTEHNTHCAWVDQVTWTDETMTTMATMVGHFGLGIDLITAANGDTLSGTYAGTFVVDFTTGMSTVEETWIINSGTGRFEGATGSGTLHLDQSVATNAGTGTTVGSIVYDASGRSGT